MQVKPLGSSYLVENPSKEIKESLLKASQVSATKALINSGVDEKKSQEPEEKAEVFCFICYQNTPNVAMTPCNHCELCKECMKEMIKKYTETCPLCKIVTSSC